MADEYKLSKEVLKDQDIEAKLDSVILVNIGNRTIKAKIIKDEGEEVIIRQEED